MIVRLVANQFTKMLDEICLFKIDLFIYLVLVLVNASESASNDNQ